MKTLCNVFGDVKVEVIQAVKDMVREGYYRKAEDERYSELSMLGAKMAGLYGISVPIGPMRHTGRGYGRYNPETTEIFTNKPSIVTFLHEFRHHMQAVITDLTIIGDGEPGSDLDAQAWACSVFKKACPRMFAKAVAKGTICGMIYRDGKLMNSDGSSEGIYPPADIREELEQIVAQRRARFEEMMAAASVTQIEDDDQGDQGVEGTYPVAFDTNEPYESGEE